MENQEQIPRLKATSAKSTTYPSGFTVFQLGFTHADAVLVVEQIQKAVDDGVEGGVMLNLSFGKTGAQKYDSGDIFFRGKRERQNPKKTAVGGY